jgi:hypothetical protein
VGKGCNDSQSGNERVCYQKEKDADWWEEEKKIQQRKRQMNEGRGKGDWS